MTWDRFRPPRLRRPMATDSADRHDAAMDQLVRTYRSGAHRGRPEQPTDKIDAPGEGDGAQQTERTHRP